MKSRNFFSLAVLTAALALTLTSCHDVVNKVAMKAVRESTDFEKKDTAKWGRVVEQDLDLSSFAAIKAKGIVRVVFTQDTTFSVRVRGNEKCIAAYRFEVRKDELKVELKDFSGSVNKRTPAVTLFIAAPDLSSADFYGSCLLEMPEPVVLPGSLNVEVEGAGEITIADLTLESLDIELNGAGRCSLANVRATGDIDLEVNGAGEVQANVFCQELDVEFNGAGSAVLSGECQHFESEANGASKIDASNLKR